MTLEQTTRKDAAGTCCDGFPAGRPHAPHSKPRLALIERSSCGRAYFVTRQLTRAADADCPIARARCSAAFVCARRAAASSGSSLIVCSKASIQRRVRAGEELLQTRASTRAGQESTWIITGVSTRMMPPLATARDTISLAGAEPARVRGGASQQLRGGMACRTRETGGACSNAGSVADASEALLSHSRLAASA